MISDDKIGPDGSTERSADLRIGTPERQRAIEALDAHLTAKRLDPTEYEARVAATELVRTQAELLRIFDDLPVPHPELPSNAAASTESDDEMPTAAVVAGCAMVGLGLPVAVVLGFVYGAWWALAVPVAATALMSYVEHLRGGSRRPADEDSAKAL